MRGYHKCSLDEAVQLAAYIYRVLYGDNTSYLDDRKYDVFIPNVKECIAQNKWSNSLSWISNKHIHNMSLTKLPVSLTYIDLMLISILLIGSFLEFLEIRLG